MLRGVEHEKSFITSGPGKYYICILIRFTLLMYGLSLHVVSKVICIAFCCIVLFFLFNYF